MQEAIFAKIREKRDFLINIGQPPVVELLLYESKNTTLPRDWSFWKAAQEFCKKEGCEMFEPYAIPPINAVCFVDYEHTDCKSLAGASSLYGEAGFDFPRERLDRNATR